MRQECTLRCQYKVGGHDQPDLERHTPHHLCVSIFMDSYRQFTKRRYGKELGRTAVLRFKNMLIRIRLSVGQGVECQP